MLRFGLGFLCPRWNWTHIAGAIAVMTRLVLHVGPAHDELSTSFGNGYCDALPAAGLSEGERCVITS